MEKILIPFSGGLDSTYLVYKNLKEGKIVQPIYIFMNSTNMNKQIIEKNQATALSKQLEKRFPNLLPLEIVYVDLENEYMQSQVWLKAVMKYIKENPVYEIQLAYVFEDICEDSTIVFFNTLRKTFIKSTNTRVKFPFLNINKSEIIKALPKYLKIHVYSCEFPYYTKIKGDRKLEVAICGYCNQCKLDKKLNIDSIKFKKFIINNEIGDDKIKTFNDLHIKQSNYYLVD